MGTEGIEGKAALTILKVPVSPIFNWLTLSSTLSQPMLSKWVEVRAPGRVVVELVCFGRFGA